MTQPLAAPPSFAVRRRLLPLFACAVLWLAACADDDASGERMRSDAPLAQLTPDASRPVLDPTRPAFVSATAVGTGCLAGSWRTTVSRDGREFENTLGAFEATVEAGQRFSFKDCKLSFKYRSTTPMQLAVSAYQARAYTFLEAGVKSFITGAYAFEGNPRPALADEKRVDVTGPADRNLVFEETTRDEALVWSPCGLDQTLQLIQRIGVQSPNNRGSGYISMSTIPGTGYGRTWFQLTTRPCVVGAPDAGPASAPATSLDAGPG